VSARARARIPITLRVRKGLVFLTASGRRWWAWTARPLSLRAAWALSAVDPKRIPGRSKTLHLMWQASNATDRLFMFALILALPTALTGFLRWAAVRPTRRWGLYLVLAVFTALLALRKG
jgi:sterol desaturase/sphingolipid hydroxylase (fatty acid hydroxylase superfamily)